MLRHRKHRSESEDRTTESDASERRQRRLKTSRNQRHTKSSSSKDEKNSTKCIHCQNVCNFHLKQIRGQPSQRHNTVIDDDNDEATLKTSRKYNDKRTSFHYLFDPTADMLYNPWLGQRFAFTADVTSQRQNVAFPASQKNDKFREFSSQFLAETVNREFEHFLLSEI